MNSPGKENTDTNTNNLNIDGLDVKLKRSFVKLPTTCSEAFAGLDKEALTDRNIIFEDSSDLPFGWSRFKERRLNSNSWDRCILTSCGTKGRYYLTSLN